MLFLFVSDLKQIRVILSFRSGVVYTVGSSLSLSFVVFEHIHGKVLILLFDEFLNLIQVTGNFIPEIPKLFNLQYNATVSAHF